MIMRNLKIELLRLFYIGIIVILHTITIGYSISISKMALVNETGAMSVLISLSAIGVTGFVFISGFYGINIKWDKITNLWTQTTLYYS